MDLCKINPDKLHGQKLDQACATALSRPHLIDECWEAASVRNWLSNGTPAERIEALWRVKGVAMVVRHLRELEEERESLEALRARFCKPTRRERAAALTAAA